MKTYLLTALALILAVGNIDKTHAQVIVTVAGNGVEGYHGDYGPSGACQLHWPEAVALDDSDNLIIADANNNVVRKIHGLTGIITTIAGNGSEAGTGLGGYSGDGGLATNAQLYYPSGVAVDPVGNVYIADQRNNRIRKVDTSGKITTVAGNGASGFSGDGGIATAAALFHPTRVCLDASNNLYIADSGNNRIRKIDASGNINTIAGNGTKGNTGDGGPATMAELFDPMDMAVDAAGNVFIADYVNNRIRRVDAASGNISTYAGIGIPGFSGDSAAATNANIYEPSGIAVDAAGNVFFSDLANARVRKINTSGVITTVAGSGIAGYGGDGSLARNAKIWFPEGLAIDIRGQLYIADKANDRIRLVSGVLQVANQTGAPATVSIFPNPNMGDFTLRVSSAANEEVRVVITNITGQTVSTLSTATNKATSVEIKTGPGIYFLSAVTAFGVQNEKILVR